MLICAATNNAGKLKELRRILEKQGHTVKSQKELEIFIEPDETGVTFEENAKIKAQAICAASGIATIADDSGLQVDALNGDPGVYSARYCGVHGNDEANNDKLIAELNKLKTPPYTARFVSAVCLMLPNGNNITLTGRCEGTVICTRKGTNGFGYDPLFVPDEVGCEDGTTRPNTQMQTYAQLEDWQKDAISHRGKALQQLDTQLEEFLKQNA